MGIKFEWLNHPHESGVKKGGIARFKIGGNYHHIEVGTVDVALQLHKLLQHAHEAGLKKGDQLSSEYEKQRVMDLLLG